ncbi:hypothetical protein [Okeania sp. SIO3I5]|nr:hypothetical protein [Okeania sp. SIO3I5]
MTQILIAVKTFDIYANQLQRHNLDDNLPSKNHVNLLPTGLPD